MREQLLHYEGAGDLKQAYGVDFSVGFQYPPGHISAWLDLGEPAVISSGPF